MSKRETVALVGNPNCGKTSVFNVLTGLRQKTGNFPGVTVERKAGTVVLKNKSVRLIDLPGTYSIYPKSEDERVVTNVLQDPEHPDHPDKIIVVADGTSLRRGMLLCSQIIDMGFPCLLVINMADLVEKEGIFIDTQKLSQELGIPVLKISALKDQQLSELKDWLMADEWPVGKPSFRIPPSFYKALEEVKAASQAKTDYQAFQLLLKPEMVNGTIRPAVEKIRDAQGIKMPEELISNEIVVRLDHVGLLLKDAVQASKPPQKSFTDKLDSILLHPFWGYVIFISILGLIFQAIFAWASYPMDLIDQGFGWLSGWLSENLPENFATDLLVNGIIAGLSGIVIFIPQIALLFMFIAILEDSGYMSRAVFLMDRVMRPLGMSGKSVIPLIGGMACAVPSIMMTRSIPNRTERLITIMVTPLVSCSARIPVYTLLIAMFVPATAVFGIIQLQGLVMLAMYLLGFLGVVVVASILRKIFRHKGRSMFITELPIYRRPNWKNVFATMYHKSRTFVVEAGKVILLISIVLWLLASYAPGDAHERIEAKYEPLKEQVSGEELEELEIRESSEMLQESYAGRIGRVIEPVIRPLGFDWKIGIALITSFAAREVFVGTMATIYGVRDDDGNFKSLLDKMRSERDPETGEKVYDMATAISLLIFFAFAMQCMSTLAVVKKETGSWKISMMMLLYMTGMAYLLSLIVYQLLS